MQDRQKTGREGNPPKPWEDKIALIERNNPKFHKHLEVRDFSVMLNANG